jgi:predicted kinase
VTLPMIVVVSGPAGAGKTTLAHALAERIGCPAVCRDEIKEGMVHASPGYGPADNDAFNRRVFPVFFDVLGVLLRAGVSVLAEAAYQDKLWRPGLAGLAGLAEVRIVRCAVDRTVARDRVVRRAAENGTRRAHGDGDLLAAWEAGAIAFDGFQHIDLPVPTVTVDTSDGYRPPLDEVVAFLGR